MTDKKCGTCGWWDTDEWPCRDDIGGCHRYPPSILSPEHSFTNGEPDLVYYPATSSDSWCGEYSIMQPDPDNVSAERLEALGVEL